MAQKGGESTYSFLGLTNSARMCGTGRRSGVPDRMMILTWCFTILRCSTGGMHNHLNLNYVNYFAGVNFGYASYGYTAEGIGNFAAGMHYVDYGTFDRTDELGQSMGTFQGFGICPEPGLFQIDH